MTPDVDVIIPVHRPDRPVRRAIESLGSDVHIRVLLVLHNLGAEDLKDYSALAADPRVVFLSCNDSFPSAAAPRNTALDHAEARWVAALDSDDWLEPDALAHWVRSGDQAKASAVVPRQKRKHGGIVRTPPKRPFHTLLHPVKDRLAYRVGHLGLTRLCAIQDLNLRYGEELSVGEDLFFSYPLWFSGQRVVFDAGPAYVVGDSGAHISTGHTADIELASLHRFLTSPLWSTLSGRERLSIAVKFIRGQIISAVSNRDVRTLAAPAERASLKGTLEEVLNAVPTSRHYLSYADDDIVEAILDLDADAQTLVDLTQRRQRSFMMPRGLTPRKWRHLFHSDAPLRFAFASAFMR